MKRNFKLTLTAFICLALTIAAIVFCRVATPTPAPNPWLEKEMWYASAEPYDTAKIDVLYFVSTEVLSATDSLGAVAWQSGLIPADKAAMTGEIDWVGQNMFYQDYNLFAPYYHQYTFDAIYRLPRPSFDSVYQRVVREACQAFDAYMERDNHGRKFVLAGFSQGAMLTLDVLRHMTDEQFSRMIVCYTIGYRLSADDLRHPHIKAATGESDYGVVVSFNSTLSADAVWPFVSEGAAACINPVNWRTDATPAAFTFGSTANTLFVDSLREVLLVSTDSPSYYHSFYDAAPFFQQAGVHPDNLHHWDLLFYAPRIHDNALRRKSVIGI